MTDGQKIIGARGSKLLTGTAEHASLTGYSFIVQEDTVVTVFEVGGVDSMTAYGLGAMKAGGYIVVPTGSAITKLQMSSGSVIIYNQ